MLYFYVPRNNHSSSGKTAVHLILICAVGLIIYSNTFHVPFQCDEDNFITNNPIVKDLDYFIEPSKASGLEQYGALRSRYIGFLTFALDYKFHGLKVLGYHVVNLSIHMINAILVYFMVLLIFSTPFLARSRLRENSGSIAFFTSLLFISHPIQTEAVTYIFQRLASLAALFYLLSITAYIKSRLSPGRTQRVCFYLLSVLSAVAAMKTKENTFTLPMIIILLEFFFLDDSLRRRILRFIPLLFTMSVIPLALISPNIHLDEIASATRQMYTASAGFSRISRLSYLFTEFRVIVTYLRVLILPVNQDFYYGYPWFHSFTDRPVFLSFLFLSAIICSGIYLLYLSRRKIELRLLSFGIFGFFIALSIESSIIPLPMFIDEYRVYLPSAFLFTGVVSGAFLLSKKLKGKGSNFLVVSILVIVSVLLSSATYCRNRVWATKISLWEDTVSKSPGDVNAHNNLGRAYDDSGMPSKAIHQYLVAARLDPRDGHTFYDLGLDYMTMGLVDRAIRLYEIALSRQPWFPDAHNNLGNAFAAKGLLDEAMKQYIIAIKQSPAFPDAHYNLGLIYVLKGDIKHARQEFETVLKIEPSHYQALKALRSLAVGSE